MDDESRRAVLSKLGMGAAAIATVATSSTALAAKRKAKIRRAARPAAARRRVLKIKRGGRGPGTHIQVKFAPGQGIQVRKVQSTARVAKVGWDLHGRSGGTLDLAVHVRGADIQIEGLNNLAAEGSGNNRCNASLSAAGIEVSNPNPALDLGNGAVRGG